MTDSAGAGFTREIFDQLDRTLRDSDWQGGAPEAHGLLTGLACRGINASQIPYKQYLFNSDEPTQATLLQGLFEIIVRSLESASPTFDLLLPDESEPVAVRAEELAGWCSGFVQGYLHDGEHALGDGSAEIQEIVRDVIDISTMEHGLTGDPAEDQEAEKSLVEVEEYLRVGIQFIYDEQVADFRSGAQPPAETH